MAAGIVQPVLEKVCRVKNYDKGEPIYLAGGVAVRYAGIVCRCPVPQSSDLVWLTVAVNVHRAEQVFPEYWTVCASLRADGQPLSMDPASFSVIGINGASHTLTVLALSDAGICVQLDQ